MTSAPSSPSSWEGGSTAAREAWAYVQGIPGWYGIMIVDGARLTFHNDREPRLCPHSALNEDIEDLLPLMPPLFGTNLPPGDITMQNAWVKTCLRLCNAWMQKARFGLVPMRPVDIHDMCLFVLRTLECVPWMENELVKYQRYWAEYFVREAEWLYERESLSLRERPQREMIREHTYPVPKELYLSILPNPENMALLERWKLWQRKKRGPVPRLDEWKQQELIELWESWKRTRESEEDGER